MVSIEWHIFDVSKLDPKLARQQRGQLAQLVVVHAAHAQAAALTLSPGRRAQLPRRTAASVSKSPEAAGERFENVEAQKYRA